MTPWAIVDAGPLVAHLDRREKHHSWADEWIKRLEPPLLVCEPALTEAMFILSGQPAAQDKLMQLLEKGALKSSFEIGKHAPEIRSLRAKYHDRPMSLADACIVRMAELNEKHSVFTLDADFRIYRKNGRDPIPLIAPE